MTFDATMTKRVKKTSYAKQCLLASGHSSSARPLITDVTTHRAPSLDGFQHFRFYCSNFAVKYLLIIADILVITYTGELMFNIMSCNIPKIRIRLSICTSSEVVLSSILEEEGSSRYIEWL